MGETDLQKFFSSSEQQTEALAEKLAKTLQGNEVIAMFGGLGAGKTAFTRGLARGLGIMDGVSSPTFALVHEYEGKYMLYHFDMYRIDTWDDLDTAGYFDCLGTDGYVLCEWAENIYGALPDDALIITITKRGEQQRHFSICTKKEYDEYDSGD